MLKITDKESHLRKPRDIASSIRVAAFFVGRAIRLNKSSALVLCFLTGLAVGGQLAFLWVLQILLERLPDENVNGSLSGMPLAEFSSGISVPILIGFSFLSLLLVGLAVFANQWVASSLNSRLFLDNMREVTRRLVGSWATISELIPGPPKLLANLYTKDCRYAAIVAYRATRAIQPLVALPFLFVYCLWLSPMMSTIALVVILLAAPFHLLLMRRGLVSMRGLRYEGLIHGISKRELTNAVAGFPALDRFDVKELNRLYVDSSLGFLRYYFERRTLAAWSALFNFSAAAAAITIVAALLFIPYFQGLLAINLVLLFIVALRFLITNVGQVITNVTTVVAVTPMCERLYDLLNEQKRSDLRERRPTPQTDVMELVAPGSFYEFPAAVVISVGSIKQFAEVTDIGRSSAATFVRGRYPALYRDLQRDLLLPTNDSDRAAAIRSLPQHVRREVKAALEAEQAKGWSLELWEGLGTDVFACVTLRAALSEAERFVLVAMQSERLTPEMRGYFEAQLSAHGKLAIQFLETFPRSVPSVPAERLLIFDGKQIWPVNKGEGSDVLLKDLRVDYDQAAKNAARRASTVEPVDVADEVDDLV